MLASTLFSRSTTKSTQIPFGAGRSRYYMGPAVAAVFTGHSRPRDANVRGAPHVRLKGRQEALRGRLRHPYPNEMPRRDAPNAAMQQGWVGLVCAQTTTWLALRCSERRS